MPLFARLVVAFAALYLLYIHGLDAVGVLGPDEPRYAAIGTSMAQSGDWITPRLWGQPWFEKPALLYWLTATGRLIGLNPELAPRLPVALCGALFLFAYYRLLRPSLGDNAAFLATVILGTSAGWLVYSHIAVTDVPLTVSFAGAMLLALPWVEGKGTPRLPWVGVLLGVAVLAKGLVPIVLCAPLFLLRLRQWREWWRVILPAVLVALPWYVLCTVRNGWPFLEEFFVKHHFGRAMTGALQHVQPVYFYIPVLLGLLFPWTPLLTLLRKPHTAAERFLWAWFVFGFVFFSLATNKLPGYLLPLLPAVCALCAVGLQRVRQPQAALIASFVLLAIVPLLVPVLPHAVTDGLRDALPGIQWSAAVLAIPGFGAAGWWLTRQFGVRIAVSAGAAAVTLSLVYLQYAAFPRLDQTASARGVWRTVAGSADAICFDAPGRGLRYGLNYYAGKEIPDCDVVPRPIRIPRRTER